MRKYLLIAAIALFSTAAHAGMSRGLSLVTDQQGVPADTATTASDAATTTAQTPPQGQSQIQSNVPAQPQPQTNAATKAEPTPTKPAQRNADTSDKVSGAAHRQRTAEHHQTRTTDATRFFHELRRFGVW